MLAASLAALAVLVASLLGPTERFGAAVHTHGGPTFATTAVTAHDADVPLSTQLPAARDTAPPAGAEGHGHEHGRDDARVQMDHGRSTAEDSHTGHTSSAGPETFVPPVRTRALASDPEPHQHGATADHEHSPGRSDVVVLANAAEAGPSGGAAQHEFPWPLLPGQAEFPDRVSSLARLGPLQVPTAGGRYAAPERPPRR